MFFLLNLGYGWVWDKKFRLEHPGPAAPAAPAMISFSFPDQGSVADDIWCQRHLRHRMKERQGERPSPRAANVQQTWAAPRPEILEGHDAPQMAPGMPTQRKEQMG